MVSTAVAAGESATGHRPWEVASAAPVAFFAELPDVHPVAAQVLYNRGLLSAEQVRVFLAGESAALHDPRSLYGMDRAIDRLRRALRDRETIAVHGDFDVDGVAATAILAEGLAAAGAQVIPYVPLRTATGYGVQAAAVERLAADGARLIVTGDTGTRATAAVERAATLGVDVIVTDHHVPGDELPAAVALVNPQQPNCPYPFKELSGAGVAWKLVQALALEGVLPSAAADALLDLVALGTIVDVSPLRGENRLLVQRGLRRLVDSPRPGIQALLGQVAAQRRPGVDERTVAFSIGPRLNAAGRMDDAGLALELLLTGDASRAAALARLLEEKNQQRQRLTEQVLVVAREQAVRLAHQPVLVLLGEDWPGGVIGLVASRIAEEYGRPAFVVDVGPDACRGSGRSVDGFDLVAMLSGCADLLLEFGGHTQAAGFATLPHHLDAFVERITAAAAERPVPEVQPIVADYALLERDLDWALYHALTPLRPFGHGNPQPLFYTPDLRLIDAKPVGAGGKHLRAKVRFGKQVLHAFGPELGARAGALTRYGRMDALYTLDVSRWNGYESMELRLEDVRPSSPSSPSPLPHSGGKGRTSVVRATPPLPSWERGQG